MLTHRLALLIPTLLLASSPALAQFRAGYLPDYREHGSAAASSQHFAYVGGNRFGAPLDTVLLLDWNTQLWSELTLSEPKNHTASVIADDRLIVAGGLLSGSGSPLSDVVELIDLTTGVREIEHLPIRVRNAHIACFDDQVFVAGGASTSSVISGVQVLNLTTRTWSFQSLPAFAGIFADSAATDRWLALAGGGGGPLLPDGPWTLHLYDHQIGSWSELRMPHHHRGASAAIVDDRLYVAGGCPSFTDPRLIDVYDLVDKEWSTILAPTPGNNFHSFGLGPYMVLAAGSLSSTVLGTVDVYNTLTETWTTHDLSHLATARELAVSEDARVAGLFGGQRNGSATDQVDYFLIEEDIGSKHCSPSVPNSTGASGVLTCIGSRIAEDRFLTLVASDLPIQPGGFGAFLAADQAGLLTTPTGSIGNLCLGTYAVLPGSVQALGADGQIAASPDLADLPAPFSQPVLAGQSWYFQAWYRDTLPGSQPTSNFTDALQVDFL